MSEENGAVTETPAELAGSEVKHATLAEALLAAQKAFPAVEPDKENGGFKGSKYVTLGNLLSKVRPVLNQHGLVLMQAPRFDEDGKFVLRTTILHKAGDSLEFDSPLTPTKNDPQGQGSAITYMRRYTAAATLAIADQEDDDGNAASQAFEEEAVARLRPERVAAIIDVFKDRKFSGTEINRLLEVAGARRLNTFTADAIEVHIAGLGEIQADALEAALDQEGEPGRLDDDRLDRLVQGYEVAGPDLPGVGVSEQNGLEIRTTPLDGLNILLGSLGYDAVDSEVNLREQMGTWSADQADAVLIAFADAVDNAGAEEVDGEVVPDGEEAAHA